MLFMDSNCGRRLPRSSSDLVVALSHQPFLLISTYRFAGAGFNKVNWLGVRSRTASAPILARCDNADEIAIDPDYAEAHAYLAMTYWFGWTNWQEPVNPNRQLALQHARRGVYWSG